MDLGHDEHNEHRLGEWMLQSSMELIAFTQRAAHKLRSDEVGLASPIRLGLRGFVWVEFDGETV